jgi:hypothetical protein
MAPPHRGAEPADDMGAPPTGHRSRGRVQGISDDATACPLEQVPFHPGHRPGSVGRSSAESRGYGMRWGRRDAVGEM